MSQQYPGQTNMYPQHYPSAPTIGFQPPAPAQMHVQQPTVIITNNSVPLGDTSVRMVCPNCGTEIMTRTSTSCSLVQHAAFFIMCITGICIICSCVPYCIDSLGNTRHECPRCHAHLGTSR